MEEDKRLKLPANWEAKKARLEWELQEEEKKKVQLHCVLYVCGPESYRSHSSTPVLLLKQGSGGRAWQRTPVSPEPPR